MSQKIDGGPPVIRANTAAAAPKPVQVATSASIGRTANVETARSIDAVRLSGSGEALQSLQRQAKAGPAPMDMAKIQSVRAALAAGEYRIDPKAIAERLDALERELAA